MVERIVGIDFGTSTSVIRVRRYENEKPIDDPKAVTFNNGSTLVPTLIRKLANGQSAYFGYDASVPKRSTTLFRNFKLNIDDSEDDKREFAKELTSEYLKYLGDSYQHQSETGFLGANNDEVKTYISYPVKWSKETQEFMVKATENAGFPNVEGLDEAQACIKAVTEQFADMLTQKGYFKPGTPTTILLIDMGAGTTDLVLCRHSPGNNKKTEILSTWPKGSEELFGGHVIDDILYNYIISSFPNEQAVSRIPLSVFKTWKESTVSPALAKGEAVDYFDALEQIEMFMGIDLPFEAIDREKFEELTGDYLQLLPKMISDILTDAKIQPDDVELVIITGGHSQWYFVREILTDAMKKFDSIGLSKIKADPDRIISLERPQETVALGLVYKQSNPVYEEQEHEEESTKETTPNEIKNLEKPSEETEPYVNNKSVSSLETIKYQVVIYEREAKDLAKNPITHSYIFVGRKDSVSDYISCYVDDIAHILYVYCDHYKEHRNAFSHSTLTLHRMGSAEDRIIGISYVDNISEGLLINNKKESVDISTGIKQPVVHDDQEQEIKEMGTEEAFHASENNFVLGSLGDGYVITKYISKYEKVIVPKSIRGKQVVAIGDDAFVNSKITYIEIPDSVVNIGNRSFMNCSNLKEVRMHDGIKIVDDYAFFNCRKLEILDFSNEIVVPGVAVFPKGLSRIGTFAFSKKEGLFKTYTAILREVTISKKTKIGSILYTRKSNLVYTFGQCAVFYY